MMVSSGSVPRSRAKDRPSPCGTTMAMAGPDPDERGVGVGIAYIGLATPEGTFCRPVDAGKRRRDVLQNLIANHALDVLRRYLTGLPVQ